MNIGILYPHSVAHPLMMRDFMEGLGAVLKKGPLANHHRLIAEGVGFGGNEKEVYEKAERLLAPGNIDILVAYIDLKVLDILKPLIYSSGKLFLLANPGANLPANWVPRPNIIQLTLLHGFLCWLTGIAAGDSGNQNTAMATTFYDCGYFQCAAMVKGLNRTGGRITHNYISNQAYDEKFAIDPLTAYLDEDRETRNLLCLFDALPASLFYSRLNLFEKAEHLGLYVSPMMLEPAALGPDGGGFKFSITGYLPWQAGAENAANRFFTQTHYQETKREATPFSLLGWETGLILERLFSSGPGDFSEGARLVEKLKDSPIEGPRGMLTLDPKTQYYLSPFLRFREKGGKKESATVDILEMENQWAEFTSEKYEGISSGWTNTYLCY